MSTSKPPPIILVANNPFGHHLLTSQLLDIYRNMALDNDLILLCNGLALKAPKEPILGIKVVSFGRYRLGVFNHLLLVWMLLRLRWTNPDAVYHLRGFVSGMMFYFARFCSPGTAKYLYDPRGAFFIEWREAGKPGFVTFLFKAIESKIIRSSVATIVTSEKFNDLYRGIFGHGEKIHTIYNSTSFEYREAAHSLPKTGPVRFVYLGTFNYWHDRDELFRVLHSAAQALGPERTEIYVYTPTKFHEAVKRQFGAIECAAFHCDYIAYHDIPKVLSNKHVGASIVRPTLSSRIASPIKISDYIALGLVPLMNTDIGDFDAHFRKEKSALLFEFGGPVDFAQIPNIHQSRNRLIYERVSSREATKRLFSLVKVLCYG